MLDYSHNWLFALAALAVAMVAGFSGLSLTRGASSLSVTARQALIAVAAVILGWGIWSMHFVAMLGLNLPVVFFFDPLVTLISALTAILIMELALLLVHFGPRTRGRISLAGGIVGIGIAVMHYIGMSGMEICTPVYSFAGVAIALIASVGLGVISFQLCYGARNARNIVLGTVGFGLTVFAVHFIAMAGTGFVELPGGGAVGPEISNEVMAMGVTVTAFVISGTFLLTGVTFLEPAGVTASSDATPETPDDAPAAIEPEEQAPSLLPVPYEKEGRTQFLDRAAIAAVRAEGHYTLIYSGGDKLFCPWSISEAENRLAPSQFIRAHRSYLVNPAYVTGFERTKDTGVCFFETTESLPKVPVSRSRLTAVRAALGV